MSETSPSRAFSPLVMIVLVLVAVFAFSAYFTLSAFAPELTTGRDGRAHALSTSAVGFAGIVRLARAQGDDISIERHDRRANPPSLTVITPEHPLTAEELSNIGGAGILIVAPKWTVSPDSAHPGWVTRYAFDDADAIAATLNQIAPKLAFARTSGVTRPLLYFDDKTQHQAGPIDSLQTFGGPDITPIVTDTDGKIVLGQLPDLGRRGIYVLADPDFLNTQGIASLDTARTGLAMLDLLHDPDGEMVFDVTLNGFGQARSILRLAFQPPFLPATLCLFAAACLLGWRAMVRSGPAARPTRAIALGKSALADNSAALIRIAGRSHRMGAGYAALTGASVAELIGLPRAEEAETAATLDEVGAAHGVGARFSDLAAEAAAAQTPARMLEAARKLHIWKEEMLRAAR